jgi:hypothetical protein
MTNERRVHGLVQDVEKKLAHTLEQLCLLFARHARVPRKRPLPRDLNVDDRHRTSPAGFVPDRWFTGIVAAQVVTPFWQ